MVPSNNEEQQQNSFATEGKDELACITCFLAAKSRMRPPHTIDFLSPAIRMPCLALPKALTASTNFWKKLMIEDRGQMVDEGSRVSPLTSGHTLLAQGV